MIVTHKFNLDLVKRELPPRIDVMQDDKYSRNLEIQLMANGKAYYPPDGCRVLIRYSKVDCTGGAYDVLPDGTEAWTIEDNVITVRLAPQVCTKNGPVKMIVTLFSGNSELNCFGLDLFVWKNPKGVYSSSRYVNVTGFIPQPASANVGQYLEVAAVDGSGRIIALQAVDAPEGGTAEVVLPENIVTADLMSAEETDSDTVPVNADTLGGFLPSTYLRHGAITATLQKNMGTLTAATMLPLTTLHATGEAFEVTDGAIKCLLDGYVLASAAIAYGDGIANTYVGIGLYKNNKQEADHYESQPLGYGVISMAARLIPVVSGDVITMHAMKGVGLVNASARTRLTLVYV